MKVAAFGAHLTHVDQPKICPHDPRTHSPGGGVQMTQVHGDMPPLSVVAKSTGGTLNELNFLD